MGDARFDDWVALAWSQLDRNQKCPSKMIEVDLKFFIELPHHIQTIVFVEGARSSREPATLERLLSKLPQCVHPSVLAAFSGPKKALTVPETPSSNLIPFFKALISLPAAPPSVQVLVDTDGPMFDSENRYCDKAAIDAAAALRHHSGLTRLELMRMCYGSLRMQHVAPALTGLCHLKPLQLGSSRHAVGTPALAVLLESFQPLQRLQHLKLHLCCLADRSTDDLAPHSRATKCRRTETSSTAEDVPTAESTAPDAHASQSECVARILCRLTLLTFLSITSEFTGLEDSDSPGVSIPLVMPYLETLRLPGAHSLLPANVTSNLTAPLKALSVEVRQLSSHVSDVQSSQKVCASLLKFEHLTMLSVKIDDRVASGDTALSAQVSSAFAKLLHLEELEYGAPFPALLAGIQSVPANLTHLTCYIPRNEPNDDAMGRWTQLLAAISRLRLCHLEARFKWGSPPMGVASLGALTGLTSLSLSGWETCLGQAADRAALSQMSQLETLHITDIEPEHAFRPATFAALVSIPNLVVLEIGVKSTSRELPDTAEWHVPVGAWQNLAILQMPVESRRSARNLIRAVARLPELFEMYVIGVGEPELSKRQERLLQRRAKKGGLLLGVDGFRRPRYHSWSEEVHDDNSGHDSAQYYSSD